MPAELSVIQARDYLLWNGDTHRQKKKHCMALVWSVERFHVYLLGREFELVTDHKPLEVVYSPKSKPSARIDRWVLRMQPYPFTVTYKPGKKNIADTLSRLLQKGEGKDFEDTANYVNFITVKAVPKAISAEEIEQAALDDEEMKELRRAIQTGKRERVKFSEELPVANELCVVGGIVLRGTRNKTAQRGVHLVTGVQRLPLSGKLTLILPLWLLKKQSSKQRETPVVSCKWTL